MRTRLAAAALVVALAGPAAAKAVTLDQACQTFASKVSTAQASGDMTKAKNVYSEGSKRIASKFNGATCPQVKAP